MNPQPMTPQRFKELLDSYGGDIRRWPEAERAVAHALTNQESPEIRSALAQAAELDGWLAAHEIADPDPALVSHVLATAPGVSQGSQRARVWWDLQWLWRGAGIAFIGLTGSAAGVMAVTVALRVAVVPAGLESAERMTAFSDLPADWSEE